jgi:DNA-binding transcriptional LysR family regulator
VASDVHVAVISPSHPMWGEVREGAGLREAQLISTRQIVVASRDRSVVDPRFVLARHRWRTDTPVAALSLILAGLGWGSLPRNYIRPQLEAGQLVEMQFENLSNELQLWVDVVWSKARPLGLAARRFVERIGGGAPSSPV